MRILFINQFYWPDAAATSQLLTDATRALAAEGHQVAVLCGKSQYAVADATGQAPDVRIYRVPCFPFSRSVAGRFLSYVSFYIGCLLRGLTLSRVDTVVTMTTPPALSVIGALICLLRGARHLIWTMDLFPESFVDLGAFRADGWLVRILNRITDWSYAHTDTIITLGECMRRRLRERNVPSHKLAIVENWADGRELYPVAKNTAEPLTLLYSGNLGLSHDTGTLLFAIDALQNDPRFQFRFVGGGSRLNEIRNFCSEKQIRNVAFLPYCARQDLAQSFGQADIGLVTQRSTCSGSVVPSKVYGLMAAGRPILYIGPRDTTPYLINEKFQCGWNIPCGDGPALVKLVREFAENREMMAAAGARARQAFLLHYDMPHALSKISSLFTGSPLAAMGGGSLNCA